MSQPPLVLLLAILAAVAALNLLSCRGPAGPYRDGQRPAHEVERGLDPVPQGSGRTETATGAGMLR